LLLYPDDTVQHGGVVLGIGGVAGHSHKIFPYGDVGYFNQLVSISNYSALTGACLMCRRDVFEEVGGLDENLAVAFNDVDLCLKILQRGYYNIYLPHVVLYHYESKSRGYEDTPEKKLRFEQERKIMKTKWHEILENDPCYSPNLTLEREDYGLNVPTMIKIGTVSVFEIDSETLWGFHIDSPKSKARAEATCLDIKGWVVGKKSAVVAVELLHKDRVVKEVNVNNPRSDVGKVYPEVLWAKSSGFNMSIGVMNFLPGTKLFLQAVLGDGSFVPLADIELGNQVLV
ncbi:MAG: glycosyltransferase family 2 protein, partial [Xenococcus sp. (in: cyanobacteria)]